MRYAGDEFIVVLSGCSADEAEQKRQELQQGVDAVYFEARPGKRLPLGISVGTAVFPHDGESYESLLATADNRMYQDKANRKRRSGRTSSRGPSAQPDAPAGAFGYRHPASRKRDRLDRGPRVRQDRGQPGGGRAVQLTSGLAVQRSSGLTSRPAV